jgi:HPt (histidine-containing phosphotransfer) domain-containing protein
MSDAAIVIELDRRIEGLVAQYLQQCRRHAAEVARLAAVGGWEAMAGIGHKLKGSGGFYHFDEISTIGREIERAARSGDAAAAKLCVRRFEEYLARVRPQFV